MTPRRARICLISSGHLSTNPRLVKEADALSEAGYEVAVISATYLPWAIQTDLEFAGRSWRGAPARAFGPLAPRPKRIWQVAMQQAARLLFSLGVQRNPVAAAALHQVATDLTAAACGIEADLYVAHYPAALPAAALAAHRHGGRYAFDAEDFHLGVFGEAASPPLEARLIEALESRLLQGCAYITAASPGIADAYAQTYRLPPPTVVLNVFPRANGPVAPTPRGSVRPGPSIYWASQTIGPNRGLECAIRALGLARSRPHLYLRGDIGERFSATLGGTAAQHGVSDRVHILPPAPPSDMERLASQYDIGFSGEPGHTPNNRSALGNKLFSYLVAGLPIVASDVPAHQALRPSLGPAVRLFAREDPEAAAAAMDDLLASAETLAHARKAAFDLGQHRFNWDLEKHRLLDLVASALGQEVTGHTSEPQLMAGAA